MKDLALYIYEKLSSIEACIQDYGEITSEDTEETKEIYNDAYDDLQDITKRIKQELHKDELIGEMVSYLWEIWNNEDLETIEENFKHLGFTEKDFKEFGIKEDIEELKEELEGE